MNYDSVIMKHQNLIYSVAHQLGHPAIIEDLFQVGCIGIMKAYDNYNPDYKVKFSTYAYFNIVGEMKRFLRQNRGVKVSRDIMKLQLKIEKTSILLSQKLMRDPTTRELAEFLEVPEDCIIEAMCSKEPIRSLDTPICENGKNLTLYDTLEDVESLDLNTLIALRDAISKLSPEERILIQKRYMEDQTQRETASILGISQVQVSRKEQKVLVKLQDKLVA